jgi:hypothetical protein
MQDVTTWMIADNATQRTVGGFFVTLEARNGMRVADEGTA